MSRPTNKFARYRLRRRARALKRLRHWIPDPRAPGFRAEAWRQAILLRNALEEVEALALIEAEADIPEA